MSSKEQFTNHERERQTHALWAAGMLECSGSLGVEQNNRIKKMGARTYYMPSVRFTESYEDRILRLQGIYGGTTAFKKPNSFELYLRGEKAISILEEVAPYNKWRRDQIEALFAVDRASYDEKESRCEIFRATPIATIPPSEYQDMMRSLPFVAGIVDARGVFGMKEAYLKDRAVSYVDPYIAVTSRNIGLIESLQQFGGTIRTRSFDGWEGDTSAIWEITRDAARDFIHQIAPYMKLRGNDELEIFG